MTLMNHGPTPPPASLLTAGFLGLHLCSLAAPQQLPPPPVPPANPITEQKRVLGKILFWEEQLSSDNTMACGTCHQPQAGGGDPRQASHPGINQVFGDLDDKSASPGVLRSDPAGAYSPDADFGFEPQVTRRSSPSPYMAAYAPQLFWDGRASGTAVDPQTGNILIQNGGALESQVFGPPVSQEEMAHDSRDWDQVCEKLAMVTPLALATDFPTDVQLALSVAPSYADLFQAAFGTSEITAARIAFAIATYERTLIPNDTPWDRFMAGQQNALTNQQRQGWQVFLSPGARCAACHQPPVFSNQTFRNIGLRPPFEDSGRLEVTGNPNDRGRFKVPSLRNIDLKPTFMHNGGVAQGAFDTLRDVIDFYDGENGHVQFNDNKDPLINGINLPPGAEASLAAFLDGGLTDPRVAAGVFPFDKPTLHSERPQPNPELLGGGVPGGSLITPQMIALTPPALGSPGFKLGVHAGLGGAPAFLTLWTPEAGGAAGALHMRRLLPVVLDGSGPGGGYQSWRWEIPADPSLAGLEVFAQWWVLDPSPPAQRYSRSDMARLTLF